MVAETEDEQLEALKNWWNENGTSLLVTIVLALSAVFGYRAWENSVLVAAETASGMYEDLSTSIVDNSGSPLAEEVIASARAIGDRLKIEHTDSAYAQLGALIMAKLAADRQEYGVAENELRWVLDNDVETILEPVVRMRLARVLAAQARFEEGLAMLSADIDPGEHRSSWEEARGDLYFEMGRQSDARQAYQLALASLEDENAKPFLKMKLEDLPVSGDAVGGISAAAEMVTDEVDEEPADGAESEPAENAEI